MGRVGLSIVGADVKAEWASRGGGSQCHRRRSLATGAGGRRASDGGGRRPKMMFLQHCESFVPKTASLCLWPQPRNRCLRGAWGRIPTVDSISFHLFGRFESFSEHFVIDPGFERMILRFRSRLMSFDPL